MNSLENIGPEVEAGGESYEVLIQSKFEDDDGKHSLLWWVSPPLDKPENCGLKIHHFLHKRFENECEPERFHESDGSQILEEQRYIHDEPVKVSTGFREVLRDTFGQETAQSTIEKNNAEEVFSFSASLYSFEINLKGNATEKVGDELLDHYFLWCLEPVEEEPRLRIKKCFHKIWDNSTTSAFDERKPGEVLLDSRETPEESPPMNSIPDEVIESLCRHWGIEIVKNSIDSLPSYVYKCIDCKRAFKKTPTGVCSICGSESSLAKYKSEEHYRDIEGNEEDIVDFTV